MRKRAKNCKDMGGLIQKWVVIDKIKTVELPKYGYITYNPMLKKSYDFSIIYDLGLKTDFNI